MLRTGALLALFVRLCTGLLESPSQTHDLRNIIGSDFFDDESRSALRKAQRNNEDGDSIKPLFSVNVDHQGAWSDPWVSTEVLAAAIGVLVYYLAFSAKSTLQA